MNAKNGISTPSRTFHKFRSLSELKDESKGGYIETKFIVPEWVKETIELEFSTKEGTAHPYMPFMTPFKKSREEKGHKKNKNDKLNMTANDYKIVLKLNKSGEWQPQKPDYVPGRIIDLVGPHFWNSETRIIKLGNDGLRLTVVKSGERQKIQCLDEVNKERNVKNYDDGKVVLKVTFDGNTSIWPIFLIDQNKFYTGQIQICSPSRICNYGDHVFFLKFEKASITTDKVKFLELILYNQFEAINDNGNLKQVKAIEKARSSNVQKLGETFAFKVDGSSLCKNENLYFYVKLNDEDIPDTLFNIETISNDSFIKVKEHNPVPGADCLCEDSKPHLEKYFKIGIKRNNSESNSSSAKKFCQNSPLTSSNSPIESSSNELSPIYTLDGNGSPNVIIGANMENPVQSQFEPENLPLLTNEVLKDLEQIPGLDINDVLLTDGGISKKQKKIMPRCEKWCCKAKPILSDYFTNFSYFFDKKFLYFALAACVFSIMIMKI